MTVCGMSATDSCAEACEQVICSNPHSVPAWNDQCANRCKSECLRGRADVVEKSNLLSESSREDTRRHHTWKVSLVVLITETSIIIRYYN